MRIIEQINIEKAKFYTKLSGEDIELIRGMWMSQSSLQSIAGLFVPGGTSCDDWGYNLAKILCDCGCTHGDNGIAWDRLSIPEALSFTDKELRPVRAV
jgi:hypothetical protein